MKIVARLLIVLGVTFGLMVGSTAWASAQDDEVSTEPTGSTSSAEPVTISGPMTQDIRVWAPDGPGGSWPVVYAVPGGDGDAEELSLIAEQLASNGVLVFVTAHTPWDYPVALKEAECGFRHVLRVAPEHGGDLTQPITTFGWSMGASIVLDSALRASEYGPDGNFRDCGDGAPRPHAVVALSGCWYQFEDQVYGFDVSGLTNTDPRIDLVVGTEDDICQAWQSEQAAEALRKADHDVGLLEIEGGDHFSVVWDADIPKVVQTILDAVDAAREP